MTKLLEKAVAQASQLPDVAQDAAALALLKTLEQYAPDSSGASEPQPRFGSAKGLVWLADDFDAPMEDFKDYM